MARPFLVPTAFATALFIATPALADEADSQVPADPLVATIIPVATPMVLASMSPVIPADQLQQLIPVATRAAGNARLPLYDDGAMMTKGCGNCR